MADPPGVEDAIGVHNMQTMVNPYHLSKLRDASYWQMRAEGAEKEMDRLRAENEKYRACLEAILCLRHALQQFDGEA